MPAWKTLDETTAAEIKSRIPGEPAVYLDPKSLVLDGNDAVLLAPTSHRGITMLITVRRKLESASSVADTPAPAAVSEIVDPPIEAEPPVATPEPVISNETSDEFFGPTSWRAIEQFPDEDFSTLPESEPVASEAAAEIAPVENAPVTPKPQVAQHAPAPTSRTPERHYVATGFLGLDEVVEDDEDLARQQRPWWKRMFLD
jgi:hypothetical protein